ncbi:hypothetical protein E3P99_00007 [Wallemia hederae]|uniref:Xylanolytic transcriptional activator regulatory domain-containing protein n=1 Tax=Wallemia hederae TaxID=1540922 RepID=A0A4T0FXW3_9BASI|nr:hypothetical protein E3P99_00007 [Wallemia hederae]
MDQEEVIFAARLNEVEEVEEAVKEYGVDAVLNARDERGNSMLHMVSANNHLDLLKKVVSVDDAFINTHKDALAATVLHQNESKSTALHWAATNGNKELAVYLCDLAKKLGGETEHKLTFATNQSGQSAASEAERGGHDDLVVELLARMDALDKGTQATQPDAEKSNEEASASSQQPEQSEQDFVVKARSRSPRADAPCLIEHYEHHHGSTQQEAKEIDKGASPLRRYTTDLIRGDRRATIVTNSQSTSDFSAKQCSYSDNNGHSIPPPKSRSEKEHESHLKIKTEHNLFASDSHGENSLAVLNDPMLKKELVMLFLDHMYPFNLVFHKPSLLYALEKDRLSPMLLNSIFALSARLSPHPKFQHIEPWKTGIDFAAIARRVLFDPDELGQCALDDAKLEVVQTALLLAAHDFGMGLFNRAYTYLGIAISQLKILGLNHDDFVMPAPEDTREKWIAREERRRTAWCVIMLDSVAAAINGRAKPFEEHDLKMFLPSDDVAFELAVGNVSDREFINSPPSSDNITTEFGYLIRIVNIFSNVMGYIYFHEKERMAKSSARSTSAANQTSQSPYSSQSCKHALAHWAQSLPPHLELSSINLNLAMMSMQAGANSSGWCYALMHAFAECSVFYLHSTVDPEANEETVRSSADRQNQSVGNMRAVIDALGTSGRKSPLLIYFVYVVSKWQLHVQGALDASMADMWDDELTELWRMDKTMLTGGNPPPVLEEEGSDSNSDKADEQPAPHTTMETIAKLLENASNNPTNLNTSVNPTDLNLLPSRNLLLSPPLPEVYDAATSAVSAAPSEQPSNQEKAPIFGLGLDNDQSSWTRTITSNMSNPYWKFLQRTVEQVAQRSKIIANASPTPTTPPVRLATLRSSADMSNFAVGCDADLGGRSEAALEYEEGNSSNSSSSTDADTHGHGKFAGKLDPFVPEQWKKTLEDGVTAKSGYAGFRTKTRTTLFGTACWDLSLHPYLAMRVRNNFSSVQKGQQEQSAGYFVNIQTEGAVRSDLFQHRLFVNGDSQWHTLVVPLSSFVLTNAGEASDQQLPMLREKVRTVGISLLANPDNRSVGRVEHSEKFDLDIEWIEAWNDSNPDVVAKQAESSDKENQQTL